MECMSKDLGTSKLKRLHRTPQLEYIPKSLLKCSDSIKPVAVHALKQPANKKPSIIDANEAITNKNIIDAFKYDKEKFLKNDKLLHDKQANDKLSGKTQHPNNLSTNNNNLIQNEKCQTSTSGLTKDKTLDHSISIEKIEDENYNNSIESEKIAINENEHDESNINNHSEKDKDQHTSESKCSIHLDNSSTSNKDVDHNAHKSISIEQISFKKLSDIKSIKIFAHHCNSGKPVYKIKENLNFTTTTNKSGLVEATTQNETTQDLCNSTSNNNSTILQKAKSIMASSITLPETSGEEIHDINKKNKKKIEKKKNMSKIIDSILKNPNKTDLSNKESSSTVNNSAHSSTSCTLPLLKKQNSGNSGDHLSHEKLCAKGDVAESDKIKEEISKNNLNVNSYLDTEETNVKEMTKQNEKLENSFYSIKNQHPEIQNEGTLDDNINVINFVKNVIVSMPNILYGDRNPEVKSLMKSLELTKENKENEYGKLNNEKLFLSSDERATTESSNENKPAKSGSTEKAPVCKFHVQGNCIRGSSCCFIHSTNNIRKTRKKPENYCSHIVSNQMFKTKQCLDFMEQRCVRGKNCPYAHCSSEIRPSPDLRKTKMCALRLAGKCQNENCIYAHSPEELRMTCFFNEYKTRTCRFLNDSGGCKFGSSCRFAHPGDENCSSSNFSPFINLCTNLPKKNNLIDVTKNNTSNESILTKESSSYFYPKSINNNSTYQHNSIDAQVRDNNEHVKSSYLNPYTLPSNNNINTTKFQSVNNLIAQRSPNEMNKQTNKIQQITQLLDLYSQLKSFPLEYNDTRKAVFYPDSLKENKYENNNHNSFWDNIYNKNDKVIQQQCNNSPIYSNDLKLIEMEANWFKLIPR